MCRIGMFVKIPNGILGSEQIESYVKELGFEKIFFRSRQGGKIQGKNMSASMETIKDSLIKIVFTWDNDPRYTGIFVKNFIVQATCTKNRQALEVITSTERLGEVLNLAQSIQSVPVLYLATAAQLEAVSTPERLSVFIDKRAKHIQATANRETLLANMQKEREIAQMNNVRAPIEIRFANAFVACIN